MTQLMLNIYITQISVVSDRQLKYSAFIPILPWSANTSLMYMCQSIPLELYYCASFLPALFVHAPLVGCPIGDCTWLYLPRPSNNNNDS